MLASYEGMAPMFFAVSSSAQQLFQLLKCINFSSKAYVQLTNTGLKFSAQDSQVMQAFVVLETKLFSSYVYNSPSSENDEDSGDESDDPFFSVNLDALLETLQIFGLSDGKDRWSTGTTDGYSSVVKRNRRDVFDSSVLGTSGICKLSYTERGAPFCIVIEEAGVTTTCELNTYEADYPTSIPFQADAVVNKVITRSEWLYDAIKELSAASPSKLTVTMSPSAPYFALYAAGAHGSAAVEFRKDPQLLETFRSTRKLSNTYKYSLIKGASQAMAMASKVSVRNDEQGVLSLQFMIEFEEGKVTFIDFRFIPFIADDEDDLEGEFEEGSEV